MERSKKKRTTDWAYLVSRLVGDVEGREIAKHDGECSMREKL